MRNKFRSTISVIFLIFVLCLSLANVSTALADEGTPTEPPVATEEATEVPNVPPVPAEEPTEEPVVEATSIPEEIIEPTTEAIESEGEASEAATDTASEPIAEIIAELPEDVSLVVMDDNGDPVALATTEAVEILADPDPFLYVSGVKKSFTAADCDPDTAGNQPCSTPIQSAINYARTHQPDNGIVYIEKGTYSETIGIDNFSFALTLQGVLNANGDPIVNPADRPVITGQILIRDFSGDGNTTANSANITLADLVINDNTGGSGDHPAIEANGNTAALIFINLDLNASTSGNSGLRVTSHSGDVVLTNVDASGTANRGAEIDNTAGNSSVGVTVTGSVFNDNSSTGLYIRSDGTITLTNVTAGNANNTGNGGRGADLDNTTGNSSVGVTVTGSIFNDNSSDGLYIRSDGTITLTNVTAGSTSVNTGNGNHGADIDNTSGSGNVTVTGSTFNNNNSDGLRVRSDGTITLVNLVANSNSSDGADISNDSFWNPQSIFVVKSTFNNNGANGLLASSWGNITLINVTAQNNSGEDGVNLSFPFIGTHTATICGGTFSGHSGSGDYNVQVNNGDNRYTNLTPNNWNPSSGWNPVDCSSVYPDPDADQLPNQWDTDDDNDGVADTIDACPVGASTGTDTDGDGCKDATEDTDDDNDGVADTSDACPVGASTGTDTDGDGCKDATEDDDDDNDGVLDVNDAFPLDPNEWLDTDGDGIGNNADPDDDNDGVSDGSDACPVGASTGTDTDGDGCKDATEDTDDDNDGVADTSDACPVGASTGTDTDGDGCKDATEDSDDDNDGVTDTSDACPVGASTGTDTDGDGCKDATEDSDDDNDGVTDTSDACPVGASAGTDTDGDGCKDNTEDSDNDNDGVQNASDACPVGASAGTDTDGDGCKDDTEDSDNDNDGVQNASDACPVGVSAGTDTDGDGCMDTAEDNDDDNDGVLDVNDAFPLDPTESVDTDDDGTGNNADTDDDNDGVSDGSDTFPLDASESVDTDGDGTGNNADTDDDNDNVLDVRDMCPLVAGDVSNDGCKEGDGSTKAVGTSSAPGLLPVTGGQATELSCTESSTTLALAGFKVAFTALCGYSAVLDEHLESSLPDTLPQGDTFVSGINMALLHNDIPVSSLPTGTGITLSFEIPAGMTGDTLTILYWDPSANGGAGDWVELRAAITDGQMVVTVDSPGTFVVVNQTTAAQDASRSLANRIDFFSLVIDWIEKLALAIGVD